MICPFPISLKLPITLTHHSNGLKIESCHGEISDLFRKMYFEDKVSRHFVAKSVATVDPPLQDTEEDRDFLKWLILYQMIRPEYAHLALELAKCN